MGSPGRFVRSGSGVIDSPDVPTKDCGIRELKASAYIVELLIELWTKIHGVSGMPLNSLEGVCFCFLAIRNRICVGGRLGSPGEVKRRSSIWQNKENLKIGWAEIANRSLISKLLSYAAMKEVEDVENED